MATAFLELVDRLLLTLRVLRVRVKQRDTHLVSLTDTMEGIVQDLMKSAEHITDGSLLCAVLETGGYTHVGSDVKPSVIHKELGLSGTRTDLARVRFSREHD